MLVQLIGAITGTENYKEKFAKAEKELVVVNISLLLKLRQKISSSSLMVLSKNVRK